MAARQYLARPRRDRGLALDVVAATFLLLCCDRGTLRLSGVVLALMHHLVRGKPRTGVDTPPLGPATAKAAACRPSAPTRPAGTWRRHPHRQVGHPRRSAIHVPAICCLQPSACRANGGMLTTLRIRPVSPAT